MTGRDRIVAIVLGALAVLAVAWLLVVTPERKHAEQVQSKVQAARSELQAARTKLAEAEQAKRSYASDYASIVSLGQAVPAGSEVPSLVYELDHASSHDRVNFESIASGTSGSGSASAARSSAARTSAAFQQLPFTFVFEGSFESLYKLIGRLQGFTVSDSDGSVQVNGRLLSIQGLTLAGGGSGSAQASSSAGKLKATVTASAYVLPPGQSLMGGATAAAPAGASPAASASTGTAVAPAIVRPLP